MKRGIFNLIIGASVLSALLTGCQTTKPEPQKPVVKPPVIETTPTKKLYVVIDDAGVSMTGLRPFLDFPAPLTVAIMPNCRFTRDTARMMAKNYPEKEYILHQPMEAMNPNANPGEGAIMSDTELEQIPWTLNKNFSQVSGAKGMNNHMGSKITANPEMMKRILQYCEQNGFYFLDSLTNARSVCARNGARSWRSL